MKRSINKKVVIKIVSIILFISFLMWLVYENILWTNRFKTIKTELATVDKIVSDMGGIEEASSTPASRGDGLLNFITDCTGSIHCPSIYKTWIIPIGHGEEEKVGNILAKAGGYNLDSFSTPSNTCARDLSENNYCSFWSGKENKKFSKNIRIDVIENKSFPKQVSNSTWRSVHININYYWEK